MFKNDTGYEMRHQTNLYHLSWDVSEIKMHLRLVDLYFLYGLI